MSGHSSCRSRCVGRRLGRRSRCGCDGGHFYLCLGLGFSVTSATSQYTAMETSPNGVWLVGHRQSADAVLQDVVVAILSAPASPEDRRNFAAWSRGIARNIAAGQRRTRRYDGDELPSEGSLSQASERALRPRHQARLAEALSESGRADRGAPGAPLRARRERERHCRLAGEEPCRPPHAADARALGDALRRTQSSQAQPRVKGRLAIAGPLLRAPTLRRPPTTSLPPVPGACTPGDAPGAPCRRPRSGAACRPAGPCPPGSSDP